VRNVNAALERVQGQQFCLYFHDDLIRPNYLQQLAAALDDNPAAMSAFCAVEQDSGDSVYLDQGRSYGGGPLQRMLDRLLLPNAGAPLRALTHRRLLDEGLRFPEGSQQGFHAQHAYLFDLISRADCVYLDQPLYRRRNWRPGALTKGWRVAPIATLADDLKLVADTMVRTARDRLTDPVEIALVEAAIGLRLLPILRRLEFGQQTEDLIPGSTLFPRPLTGAEFPERWAAAADSLADEIHKLEQRWQTSRRTTG
jgi:hypothetical protein